MGRPRKEIGTDRFIECVQCGKQVMQGIKVSLSLTPIEVTPDFFISDDSTIEDYDMFICGKECLIKYLQENLK